MYENTSYDDRKRCKDCIVLNRLRERDASLDRINVYWQLDNKQSDILEMIVMKLWHWCSDVISHVRINLILKTNFEKRKRAFHNRLNLIKTNLIFCLRQLIVLNLHFRFSNAWTV